MAEIRLNSTGAKSSNAATTCSLLIAEDCPDTVHLLETYLAGPQIALTVARTGSAAIDAFQSGVFNLVLMDLGLPDVDGYEVIRNIRKWEEVRAANRTPVAALTAVSDFDASARILSAGFTMHLVKPISRPTLLQIVGQYGSRKRVAGGTETRTSELVPTFSKQQIVGSLVKHDDLLSATSIQETIDALVPEYLSNLNLLVAKMALAIEGRDYPAVLLLAHQIAGSAGAFGFPKVSEYAREIERTAKRTDVETLMAQTSKLHVYVESTSASWGFTVQGR